MPLDPSIALSVKPFQIDDPIDQYSKVATLKGLMNQQQMQANQLQDYQRQRNEQTQLRDLFSKNTAMGPDGKVSLNKQTLLGDLFKAQPEKALEYQSAWQKQDVEQSKLKREEEKAKIEGALQHINIVSQLMSGVTDQASYDRARAKASAMGLPDVDKLNPIYDPAEVEQARNQALTTKDQLEQHWKQKNYDLDVNKFGEQKRHNRTIENNSAAGLGLQRERLNFEKGKPDLIYDPLRGVLVDKRTGQYYQTTDANGQPLPQGSGKPLTESQGNAALFGKRAEKADQILGTIGDSYDKATLGVKQFVEGWPLIGTAANAVTGEKSQQVDQAQRDFINAVLRKESGAAIGKGEFENAKKQYFPQVGDSPAVIKQKAENRKTAIEGLRVMAGPGAQMMDEAEQKRAGTPKPKAQATTPPLKNAQGWTLHTDAKGNKAYVSPDGKQFQEVK